MSIDIIDTSRTQDAVYWAPVVDSLNRVTSDRFSNPILQDPVELLALNGNGVMWLDKSDIIMDQMGQNRTSKSLVFLGIDVEYGGVLFLGTIADIPAGMANSPLRIPRTGQILRFDKLITIEGDQYVRKAYL